LYFSKFGGETTVNSEELELSLRTEFENYLKDVVATMRQDVADLQKNFDAEFEKHKSQMDEAFRNLTARFESDVKFDKAFTESVVEHLRLARDDGAQLSAQAFSDAQKLEPSSSPSNYDQLRDAINDISSQGTQSAILKSLVDHVARFTARGAFFIVKHDSFICWRKFDPSSAGDDDSVREITFPVSADTLLADAVQSQTTRHDGSHSEDNVYLDALGFGRPVQMFAVPLMARGRAVAVLYVDSANEGDSVSVEAIESMVRVAGLTVELRAASASAAQPAPAAEAAPAVEAAAAYAPTQVEEPAAEEQVAEQQVESAPEEVAQPEQFESAAEENEESTAPAYEEYTGEVVAEEVEYVQESQPEVESFHTPQETYFEPVPVAESSVATESTYEEVETSEPEPERVSDFAFASSDAYDASAEVEAEPEVEEEYSYTSEVSTVSNGHAYEATPEPVVEVAVAQPMKSRLSDRHVDLPIEVSDDERRLHNDARRFARLLVSEIKLYNEQKVNEGRDSSDLYDRLREAIDRSREMYDRRVQPQVAAKFDYFHYELVSNLAEGNDAKLGAGYPGASV
jgi:hypothetical protein